MFCKNLLKLVEVERCVLLEQRINFYSTYRHDEYQFLPKSVLPTLHFQPSLPRLPIPSLNASCKKYLQSQKALTSEIQFVELQKIINEFEANEGPKLQEKLVYLDSLNKHTSYITQPWFEMYLRDRRPLPINLNPFLVFVNDPKPEYNEQLIRATNLLISSLRFMKSLRKNILAPEIFYLNPKTSESKLFSLLTGLLPPSLSWYGAYIFQAYPLDMSQYNNIFNTTRIPEERVDKLYFNDQARHITVMKEGHIYKVDVLDEEGYIYDPLTIYSSLMWIINDRKETNIYPVGILTTENRNNWAEIRKRMSTAENQNAFRVVDSAIINLVFDMDKATEDYCELTHRFLHSNGLSRWFDKSVSLIVCRNGIAGLNFEHSWGDGVAVLRFLNEVYDDSTTKPQIHPHTVTVEPEKKNVKLVEFVIDDYSKQAIESAKKRYYNAWTDLGIEVLEYKKFGRILCKKHEISPDLLMQLAFQLAYYKLNGKFVSTYESCSTAAFKHGRTETVRPLTVETKVFVESLFSKNKLDKGYLLNLVKECSRVHTQLIKDAAMGQGFDRHLFMLHKLAEESGSVPSLFNHPMHQKFNRFLMSTSTLNSDKVMLGAFGPVDQEGFGIGYSIWNDRLGSIVTWNKSKSDGAGFKTCLEQSLLELNNILS